MAAARSLALLGGLALAGLAGCYSHYPYGPYGYNPYGPVYTTTPGAVAPGTIIGPGVESLGAPTVSPDGTFQPPYDASDSSYNNGDLYQRDGQTEQRNYVPDYRDPNDPGAAGAGGTGTFGSGNTTPFGQ
jgi:hypothetical protein